jgi:hypothetical protein
MKKSIFTLTFIYLLAFASFAQTIRRVTNTLGLTGVNLYATAQAAHDAAVAGDIIYLEPSSVTNNDFGSLELTKQLTIVGPGYLLDKNPNTSFDTRVPRISTLRFQKGSANSSITGVHITSSTFINCNNITISRCRIQGIALGTNGSPATYGSYATINKCLIEGNIYGNASDPSGDNCTFSNNLIVNGSTQVIMSSLDNCTINNNTFASLDYGRYGGQLAGIIGCVISNNIFDYRNYTYAFAAISSTAGTTFSNNVCIGISALPSGNGNVNGASGVNLYANENPLQTITNLGDNVFQLGVGSAAIGVGTGGTNAGAFGGANLYLLSGIPAIPIITNFITSGVGNPSTPLNVSISVRGNN